MRPDRDVSQNHLMLNLRRRDDPATYHTGVSAPRPCPQPSWCREERRFGQPLPDRQTKFIIGAARYPPRSIEEAATLDEQMPGGIQLLLTAATAVDCPVYQRRHHGASGSAILVIHCCQSAQRRGHEVCALSLDEARDGGAICKDCGAIRPRMDLSPLSAGLEEKPTAVKVVSCCPRPCPLSLPHQPRRHHKPDSCPSELTLTPSRNCGASPPRCDTLDNECETVRSRGEPRSQHRRGGARMRRHCRPRI